MFSSMISELYQLSQKLIVQLDERLIPLFRRSFSRDIIYYSHNKTIPETLYDYHIPFGSLPMHFRPDLKSFKQSSGAYLKADKSLVNKLRKILVGKNRDYLIGLTWRGGNKKDSLPTNKSIDLKRVARVLNKKNIKIVSLQYGDTNEEFKKLKTDYGIEVYTVSEVDNFNDLDGLAALVDACDHIVSTDNLTVPIAGALGKKTTVLLPFSAEWRWGVKREDSYWHSSVRLLRKENVSDWSAPLEKLNIELETIRNSVKK